MQIGKIHCLFSKTGKNIQIDMRQLKSNVGYSEKINYALGS